MSNANNAVELTFTQKRFNEAFESATPVAFQESWRNATGYLDYAANEEFAGQGFEAGQRLSFVDNFGRRAVLIIVAKGHNLVVFERYSPSEEGRSKVFVSNTTRAVKKTLGWDDGAVSGDDMEVIGSLAPYNAYGRFQMIMKYADVLKAAA